MPDPTPTTDTKGKKLSKNTILLIGGGGILLFLWYRNKKKKEEEEGPKPGTNPYTAQSFIPVTGENVAGAGAAGLGGATVLKEPEANQALLKAEEENLKTITQYLTAAQEHKSQGEQPIVVNVSGGGPPSTGQINTGGGSGGGGSGATTTNPVSHPAAPSCPAGWKWNPADGPPSIHSCYHISREKAKKPGYVIHGYQDGHEVESRP